MSFDRILTGRINWLDKIVSTMRLFTGISLAPNVAEKLADVLGELTPTASINWSPLANLHITCRFIGPWPEGRLSELTGALDRVGTAAPISIAVSRFGFFPNPHRPHSLFAGVQASPGLAEVTTAIDRELVRLGAAAESRPYQPHVTLARMKGNSDLQALREHIAGMTDFEFGAFEAREFHLYLSQPTTKGSVYTKLATYDLMRENNGIS